MGLCVTIGLADSTVHRRPHAQPIGRDHTTLIGIQCGADRADVWQGRGVDLRRDTGTERADGECGIKRAGVGWGQNIRQLPSRVEPRPLVAMGGESAVVGVADRGVCGGRRESGVGGG